MPIADRSTEKEIEKILIGIFTGEISTYEQFQDASQEHFNRIGIVHFVTASESAPKPEAKELHTQVARLSAKLIAFTQMFIDAQQKVLPDDTFMSLARSQNSESYKIRAQMREAVLKNIETIDNRREATYLQREHSPRNRFEQVVLADAKNQASVEIVDPRGLSDEEALNYYLSDLKATIETAQSAIAGLTNQITGGVAPSPSPFELVLR